jgi:hypothetical protein
MTHGKDLMHDFYLSDSINSARSGGQPVPKNASLVTSYPLMNGVP